MASANLENLSSFPEVPNLNPPAGFPDCDVCRGWGVILGTDTPDSWGDPCGCGRDIDRPRDAQEAQDLHAAHMQRRLHPLAVRS